MEHYWNHGARVGNREFGFTNPVLIDEEDGIIAGHGRVLGVHLLGLDEVPCIANFAEHEFINGKIVDLARVVSHWAHEAKSASDLHVSGLVSRCSTHPSSLSPGREQRWRRRGGLLRRENLRREGENHSLNYEAGMHLRGLIGKTIGTDGLKALQAVIERAGQTITAI